MTPFQEGKRKRYKPTMATRRASKRKHRDGLDGDETTDTNNASASKRARLTQDCAEVSPTELHKKLKRTRKALKSRSERSPTSQRPRLNFEHLDRSTVEELREYALEKNINMGLYGSTKLDYVHAILTHHLQTWRTGLLELEARRLKIDMSAYGSASRSCRKRKMDYINAIIDSRLGKSAGELKLWEEWKEIYLVGTEWAAYDSVFDIEWEFDHLRRALADGGMLYEAGADRPVYLFGLTEPQYLTIGDRASVIYVPAIVAILSSLPPPDQVGITSVQKAEEELVPMRELKMGWAPYIPEADRARDPRTVVPRAFFLKTWQRREALKSVREEELRRFNYALPYIFLPHMQHEPSLSTTVDVVAEVNGLGAFIQYDWEFDDLEEIASAALLDRGLDPKLNPPALEELKATISEAVRAQKQTNKQELETWQANMNAISAAERYALEGLRIIKFYPQNKSPQFTKAATVNRYYGNAHHVY